MSSQSFADLGVSAPLVKALSKRGIKEPFAIQKLVVPDVLAGRDVLAKSPTGSGKTLAFGIPLLENISSSDKAPSALILAPTRELGRQITDELAPIAAAKNLRVCTVYGGVGIQRQANEAKRAHVIVATPGRLEDLLARRAFTLSNVKILVLDEADRMLDMGFRPCVHRIVEACRKERQTLFFSATLDGEVGKIAKIYTNNAARHEHVTPVAEQGSVDHKFFPVHRDARLKALVKELAGERKLALVFVRTKRGADRLVKRLDEAGVRSLAIHGDKSQRQREQALARFESGKVDTLIATDVAARGIDVDDISHVINFDPPQDRETYVHRVGRTARAGRHGIGITYYGRDEARDVSRMASKLSLKREFERAAA